MITASDKKFYLSFSLLGVLAFIGVIFLPLFSQLVCPYFLIMGLFAFIFLSRRGFEFYQFISAYGLLSMYFFFIIFILSLFETRDSFVLVKYFFMNEKIEVESLNELTISNLKNHPLLIYVNDDFKKQLESKQSESKQTVLFNTFIKNNEFKLIDESFGK